MSSQRILLLTCAVNSTRLFKQELLVVLPLSSLCKALSYYDG
jgi:hypothetical protein